MEIIRFPGGDNKAKGNTSTDPNDRMIVGPMSFTCTTCGDTCHADFKGIVFRCLDFHCSGCGTFFKITNPAFSTGRRK